MCSVYVRRSPLGRLGRQVGGLCLFKIPAGGLVGEEAFGAKTLCRLLHARDVLLTRERVVALQQSQAPPRMGRRFAVIPDTVAVHVYEHFLAVQRLDALTREGREGRRTGCGF